MRVRLSTGRCHNACDDEARDPIEARMINPCLHKGSILRRMAAHVPFPFHASTAGVITSSLSCPYASTIAIAA